MRHRTYKVEHLPASLRPTMAAAMVRLAGARHGEVVLDPMCGTGTILAEQREAARAGRRGRIEVLGGDLDRAALRAAVANLRRLGPAHLARWDAARLPLASAAVDCVISNPPFGKQLSRPEEIGPLYRRMVPEYDRVLKAGGRAVLLVSDLAALKEPARAAGWVREQQLRVRILGQPAALTVWRTRG
jgi:23S rRNA G2445 N2-methylase RlmL